MKLVGEELGPLRVQVKDFRPTKNLLVCRLYPQPERSDGGVYLPQNQRAGEVVWAKVIHAGHGCRFKSGDRVASLAAYQIGDRAFLEENVFLIDEALIVGWDATTTHPEPYSDDEEADEA